MNKLLGFTLSQNFNTKSNLSVLRSSYRDLCVLNEKWRKNNITSNTDNTNTNKKYNLIEIAKVDKYIVRKNNEILNNSYNPDLNNKKLLVLIATHVNSDLKLNTIKKTIEFLNFNCVNITVANTKSLELNNLFSDFCKKNNVSYNEVENDSTYDFGKWAYLLSKIDYSLYDFIFFTNDSFIIEKPITHFINLTIKKNVELYGYNDSTQRNYHYQSYLFSIRSNAIYKFIQMFNSKKHLINDQEDVVTNYELKMIDNFFTHDCFLKIGYISFHKGLNIFFTSDYLYEKLNSVGILPFIKIKRILQESSSIS
jgi:hypothetical protein